MAETSKHYPPIAPCDTTTDTAISATSPTQHHPSPSLESKTISPIANRVCTPLGLFVHPPNRGLPMTMPQTLTPESAPASPTRRDKVATSTSPIRQPGASPTRSKMVVSDCMRKRTDSISDAIRAAAANTRSKCDDASSPLVPVGEMQPLHTGTVLANTKMVHPKPISRVLPADITSRPGTASSVAQLEMTAQQLSMTSSIDDAIRDLHGELKRSDSRRSSILAATLKTGDETGLAAPSQLKRHLSSTSSIVSTNIAARQGGYSPAAFVKSPSASGSGRLIPGSLTAASPSEAEDASLLSRHGPGKSSVRSVRSSKLSLADISESEPISLTQTVLDEADNAPPLELEPTVHEAAAHKDEGNHKPTTNAFHEMMQGWAVQQPAVSYSTERNRDDATMLDREPRPDTSHSQDTFHQAQVAFFDFDGVHCPDHGTGTNNHSFDEERLPIARGYVAVDQHMDGLDDHIFNLAPLQLPRGPPQPPTFSYGDDSVSPPPPPVGLVRPQSFFDPASGVQMNYYPARVPATLNIPPKLSNKPKALQRNTRQSKVLSVMMSGTQQTVSSDAARRASAMPILGSTTELADPRPAKERHHERRPSFLPLSPEEMQKINEPLAETVEPPALAQESCDNLASTLRIPKRITEPKTVEKRKSRMSIMGNIPSQLRASAYFDSPAITADIEAKNGSAMNALDDILDAGVSAPVGAFTDHLFAGKLGSEIYGTTKRPSHASSPSLPPASSENGGKKRSSWMALGRRSHSRNSQDISKLHSGSNSPHLTGEADSDHVRQMPTSSLEHNGEEPIGGEEENEEALEEYVGVPSTLLAELQIRKQQQKDRIQNNIHLAHGTQATLLELDTVAETQRNDRKSKRVNLLWEDPEAHLDQNGSDDEDIPLAIIAARQQGAKNMADLERPIGLIEKREIEENEPLSKRRARLQGWDNSFFAPRPQSMLMAPTRLGDTRPRQSMISLNLLAPEDVEGETLADRRKRLASNVEQDKGLTLPPARPVSAAFSAELLSQFDPTEAGKLEGSADGKDTKVVNGAPEEEETLGQRRRRLQAEKMARQQEMAHGVTAAGSTGHHKDRRTSLASVLSVHPRKSPDLRVQEQIQRREQEERIARENEAKMSAMRLQMPSTLSVPGAVQKGGFYNGAYNNGYGGRGGYQRPVSAQVVGQGQLNRPNSIAFNHGPQQGVYVNPYAGRSTHTLGAMHVYNGANGVYGGMQPNNQMQMPHNPGSMDRVESWRQGVFP